MNAFGGELHTPSTLGSESLLRLRRLRETFVCHTPKDWERIPVKMCCPGNLRGTGRTTKPKETGTEAQGNTVKKGPSGPFQGLSTIKDGAPVDPQDWERRVSSADLLIFFSQLNLSSNKMLVCVSDGLPSKAYVSRPKKRHKAKWNTLSNLYPLPPPPTSTE